MGTPVYTWTVDLSQVEEASGDELASEDATPEEAAAAIRGYSIGFNRGREQGWEDQMNIPSGEVVLTAKELKKLTKAYSQVGKLVRSLSEQVIQ